MCVFVGVNVCVAKGELCCCYCCWEQSSSCQAVSQGRFRLPFASALVATSASVAVPVVVQVKAMRLVQQPSIQGQRAWQEESLTHTRAHIFGLASGFLSLSSCCQCNFYARQCAAAASEAADKLCIQRGVCASVCCGIFSSLSVSLLPLLLWLLRLRLPHAT